MPRAFAKVNVGIWTDPDFRRLPPAAQHLYLLLWTAPDLSFCGVHDWRPGRLSHLSEGFTEEHTRTVADCLAARHFLVIDKETEEVLIRSWTRFDEVLKQPRLAISFVNAYASTYSETLRSVVVHEARRIKKEQPNLTCWKDERVSAVLEHPAISAKDLPVPSDPFGDGFTHDFGDGFGLGLGQTQGKVWASVSVPPTTADSRQHLADKQTTAGASRKRAATQLADDWAPNDKHVELAASAGVDLEREAQRFKLHAEANDRRQVNWNAAFSQWLLSDKTPRSKPASEPARLPHASELTSAPTGMTDEQYEAWLREGER